MGKPSIFPFDLIQQVKTFKALLLSSIGSSLIGFLQAGTGAVTRTAQDKMREFVSVLDYIPVEEHAEILAGTSSYDATADFQAARAANPGKLIYVPIGTYLVGNIGGFTGGQGAGFIGASAYRAVLKVKTGTTGAIFYNTLAGTSGSLLGRIESLGFDMNGQAATCIDLSHCDSFRVSNVYAANVNPATSYSPYYLGTFVKFGAPTNSSSYSNVIEDFYAQGFDTAVIVGLNANQNHISRGSLVNNVIGIDCAPGGVLGRPTVMNVRIEGNTIGIKDGAQGGVYLAYFENNPSGDVAFTVDSDDCVILPGSTTAVTPVPLVDTSNATNLRCLSDDLGYVDFQDSTSRIRYERGRNMRRASNVTTTMPIPSGISFTDMHGDPFLLANASGNTLAAGLYGVNAAGTNLVAMMSVDAFNRINIPGYDSQTATYARIYIGPNFNFNPNVGLEWAGVKVLGSRKTGWAVDTGTAKRTANATYTAGAALTFGATYVEAELDAVGTRLAAVEAALQNATQTIKALKDDLHATAGHGLIGT